MSAKQPKMDGFCSSVATDRLAAELILIEQAAHSTQSFVVLASGDWQQSFLPDIRHVSLDLQWDILVPLPFLSTFCPQQLDAFDQWLQCVFVNIWFHLQWLALIGHLLQICLCQTQQASLYSDTFQRVNIELFIVSQHVGM